MTGRYSAISFALLILMTPAAVAQTITSNAITADAITADAIAKGRTISENHCSRCHVVADYNPNGGISSTPSFQLLVNALKDYKERFNTFYARPPHPAVIIVEGLDKLDDLPYNAAPVKITLDDVNYISAFADTLKNR